MRNKLGKAIIFVLILVLPTSILFFLSSGDHEFAKLPYRNKIKEFSFLNSSGNTITSDDFSNKIIVAMVVANSCPDHCAIAVKQFKKFVYEEINTDRYDDLAIISQVVDYYSDDDIDPSEIIGKLGFEEDHKLWHFVTGDYNAIYDFDLEGKNLYLEEKEGIIGGRPHYELALLIDKDRFIRGLYQINKTSQLMVLLEDIRILKREYNEKANAKKKK